ncbi:MAG: rhomboid family intramembrane serine protease [Candidatus Woesearchaeota archaeon]
MIKRLLTFYVAITIVVVFVFLQVLLGLNLAWSVGSVELQFFTSMLAHGSPQHLLGNVISLLIFGVILEGTVGGERFLRVLFTAAIIGNLAAIGSYDSVLGLSGGIYGLIGALMVLRPTMLVWLPGLPLPMILLGFVYAFIDLVGAFAGVGNTGHLAHLAGLGVGVYLGFVYRRGGVLGEDHSFSSADNARLDEELDEYEKRYLR